MFTVTLWCLVSGLRPLSLFEGKPKDGAGSFYFEGELLYSWRHAVHITLSWLLAGWLQQPVFSFLLLLGMIRNIYFGVLIHHVVIFVFESRRCMVVVAAPHYNNDTPGRPRGHPETHQTYDEDARKVEEWQ